MDRFDEPQPISPLATWRDLWTSGDALNLRVQEAYVDATGRRPLRRVVSGDTSGGADGAGAVMVAVRGELSTPPDRRRIVMVRCHRFGPGVELWELPRGSADRLDASLTDVAVRELREETGLEATEPILLGRIFPDSGLIGTATGVVLASVPASAQAFPADGENDAVVDVRWAELPDLVRDGRLRDGISLSALALTGAALDDADRLPADPYRSTR